MHILPLTGLKTAGHNLSIQSNDLKWLPLYTTEDFQLQVQKAETMLEKINKNLESEHPYDCNRSPKKELCADYISEKNFPQVTKILEKMDKEKEQQNGRKT